MTIAEDDLPVLTQVLRTGDGRLPSAEHDAARASEAPESLPGPHRAVSEDTDGDPSWPRALVIGSDPDSDADDGPDVWRDASSIRRAAVPAIDEAVTHANDALAMPAAPLATPHGVDAGDRDVFLRSAPLDGAFLDRLDEPPLIDRTRAAADAVGRAESPASSAVSRDVPLAFGDRPATIAHDGDAALAHRVRDHVLQELSARIDTELDARIAQTLHATLETALAHLQAGLRAELAEALRDVVGRAVDDAVARLRDTSGRDGVE